MKIHNLIACLFAPLMLPTAPIGYSFVIYYGFDVEFTSGPLAGQGFVGKFSYYDGLLKGKGLEFIKPPFLEEPYYWRPGSIEAMTSLEVTIGSTRFTMDDDRSDPHQGPWLLFDNGQLQGLEYVGTVGDAGERASLVIGWERSGWTRFSPPGRVSLGEISIGATTMIPDDMGPGSLPANQLRWYRADDWRIRNYNTRFPTPYGEFVRNDSYNVLTALRMGKASLLIEGLFGDSGLADSFGVIGEGGQFQPLLSNLDPTNSALIDRPLPATEELGFLLDRGDGTSKLVSLSDIQNVRSYVSIDSGRTYLLWLLEDGLMGEEGRDDDFNDFILLATLNTVPEPAVMVTLLALLLGAAAIWRRTRVI